MAIPSLPDDFKEFLKLLGSNGIEYLLIGRYAVNIYGYVRTTNDLDVWVNVNPENAARIDHTLREFGFATAELLVPVISLARLRQNKAASGRAKDLADLENLRE